MFAAYLIAGAQAPLARDFTVGRGIIILVVFLAYLVVGAQAPLARGGVLPRRAGVSLGTLHDGVVGRLRPVDLRSRCSAHKY